MISSPRSGSLLAVVSLLLGALVLGGPTYGVAQTTWQVQMTDNLTFQPATINIVQGDTVRWTNVSGSVSHTATADSPLARRAGFNSGSFPTRWLSPGESFDFTFTSAGQFPYHCIPHQNVGMVGTVNVTATTAPLLVFVGASASDEGVLVAWKVRARSGRVGFHVLRSTGWGNAFVRVDSTLIPGSPAADGVYRFTDATVTPGTSYYYVIADIDAAGYLAFWGPAIVSVP